MEEINKKEEEIKGILNQIDFVKMDGLIPVIAQDYKTSEVLMVGFTNEDCLKKTIKKGRVVYWSRRRKKEWTKGETSGNYQIVKEIYLDCDNDTILIKIEQVGNSCHTGNKTCFFKKIYEQN